MPRVKESKEHQKIQQLNKKISELSKKEKKLRVITEQLNSIMANIPGFIAVVDRYARFKFVNRIDPRFTYEQVMGSKVNKFLDPAYHGVFDKALKKVFDTGEHADYEAMSSYGRWFVCRIGPIRKGKKIIEAIIIATDVTDLKKEQNKLQLSKIELQKIIGEKTTKLKSANVKLRRKIDQQKTVDEKLRQANIFLDQVVENIPNMIFVKDAKELRFVRFNKAGEKLLGYSRKDLIGKNDYDFFPKIEADFFTENDRKVLEGKKPIDIPEEAIKTKRGLKKLHTKKIGIFDKKGRPIYLLGISEDITEKRQAKAKELRLNKVRKSVAQERLRAEESRLAYEKLKSLQPRLVQSEKLSGIGQLAAGVAHELNSPLAGLISLLRRQKRQLSKKSPGDIRTHQVMLDAAEHMAKVVASLKSFSGTSKKGKWGIIDFNDVIESTLSFSAYQLIENNITIDKHYTKKLKKINGDKSQLQQVVLNIITNAKDAMNRKGQLTIKTRNARNGGGIIVEFTDTGRGIQKRDMDRIFEPFFTTKSDIKGVGIGLAISMDIIKSHHGELKVKSVYGKGTTFALTLPCHSSRQLSK